MLRPPRAEMRVRPATAADHAAIRDVIARAYRQYESILPPAIYKAYQADLADFDGRAGAELLVAEAGAAVVGTVTFYADAAAEGLGWPAGWAGVRALGVDPAQRGLGIARRLMRACTERAAEVGAPVVCLHTAEFMPEAVRLYEGLGYRRAPSYDVDVAAPLGVSDDAVNAIAYTRTLTDW